MWISLVFHLLVWLLFFNFWVNVLCWRIDHEKIIQTSGVHEGLVILVYEY